MDLQYLIQFEPKSAAGKQAYPIEYTLEFKGKGTWNCTLKLWISGQIREFGVNEWDSKNQKTL